MLWLVAFVALLGFGGWQNARAASFAQTGFSESDIPRPDGAATWNEAAGITFSSSGRMFVWEKAGRVWIVDPDDPVPHPFVDIADEVLRWREHGLSGFVLDPQFERNGYVYLLYAVDPQHLFLCDSPAVGMARCAASYDANTSWQASDPASPGYRKATIGRITRYTALRPVGERDFSHASQIDYATRRVLVGETRRDQPRNTGIPLLSDSRGVGALLFGDDGSLLASVGDGASGSGPDVGGASDTFHQSALADGIIRPAEDVGALRAQLLDSLSGKVLRIDPASGDGYASNPFYDRSAPRAARSRVWARGFGNPHRMALRPGSGSASAAQGNPGVILLGDRGRDAHEELNVIDVAGGNYGSPFYEGFTAAEPSAASWLVVNRDAPNPLFGSAACTQQHFRFSDLLVDDSFNPVLVKNPCDASQPVPAGAVPARHLRPVLDWPHDAAAPARWASYAADGSALALPLGTFAPGGTVVSGSAFSGQRVTAGVMFEGTGFPAGYGDRFFLGDQGGEWIRTLAFDPSQQPHAVESFAAGVGPVIAFGASRYREGLFYVDSSHVRQVIYVAPGTAAVRTVDPLQGTPARSVAPTVRAQIATPATMDAPAQSGAADTTAPTIPAGLSASISGTTQITLTWNASSDAGSGVAGYRVLRNGALVGSTGAGTLVYTDGALAAATTYTYAVVAFDNASPANVSAASASITASTAATVLRLKTGGGAFTDSAGQVWAADSGFNTGLVSVFNQPIAGTVEDGLYQSERYDPWSAPEMQYSFAVPNGAYQVRLHFAENWATAPGVRVFDVDIEGVRRFEDIDIHAEAGWRTALVKSANVFVADGRLDIGFVHQADNPLINAIEIIALAPVVDNEAPTIPTGLTATPLSATQIRLAWNASSDGGSGVGGYRVLRNGAVIGSTSAGTLSFADGALAPITSYTYAVVAFDNAAPANVSAPSTPVVASTASMVLRIKAGGGAFTDSQGLVWAADAGFNTGQVSTFNQPIAGTAEDGLYQSERYDTFGAPDLEYAFGVPSGSYQVRLHFAENWATAAGARVFGVDIEGVRRFQDIDILAQAGWRTALVKSATLLVTDGQLNIRFVRQAGDPLINAIEIIGVGPPVDNSPPTVPGALTATALSTSEIRLAWQASSDIDGMGVAGYRVLRDGVVVGSTSSSTLTFTDSGLTANTAYRYAVVAFDSASPANVSVPSTAVPARTLAPDTTAPSVPAGLAAAALSTTQIRLAWSASTDTGGSGLAGYRVLRNGAVVGSVAASTLGFTDTALGAGTTYTYAVVAFDQASPPNASAPSGAITATTLAPDITAPSVPTGLTATILGSTQIRLAWSASSDTGSGVAGYRVLRNGAVVGSTGSGTLTYVDSALSASTPYTYAVAAFDNASPANVSAPSPVLMASTASLALRINAGGGAFTDAAGQVWAADTGFNTGQVSSFGQPVAGTEDDGLYQSERYDTSAAPDLEYAFGVPSGTYQVRLHFAENWATAAGARVFDVDVEGVRRLQGIDIYAQAGWRAALVKSFTLIVTDGQLNIRFVRQVGDPLINAIEVIGLGPAVDNSAPTAPTSLTAAPLNGQQIRLSWNASSDGDGTGVGGYRVLRNGQLVGSTAGTVVSYTDGGLTAGTDYNYTVVAFDNATPANVSAPSPAVAASTATTVLRINAGGPAFTDSMGQPWSGDAGFNTGQVSTFNQPIANTVDDLLYQGERYDPFAAPDLTYSIPVPPATYEVRLHFAENWATSAGSRVFHVDIEGVRRFDDVDIYAQAGPRAALVKSANVVVVDGQLDIRFVRRTGDPLINAIEVIGLSAVVDRVPPTVPNGVTVTPLTATQVRLTWNASTDPEGLGVGGYRVLRNGVPVGSTDASTLGYTDSALAANTSYSYTVAAFDNATPANVSAQSAAVAATTLRPGSADITSPTAPPHSAAMVGLNADTYLRVNGAQLVTAAGKVVQLRGLNIGGWLVTENWMNGFTDSEDASGNQYGRSALMSLEARFGAARAAELMGIWQDNWITTRDLDRIRDGGFNLIRVPFSYRTLQNADGSWILDASGRIDFSRMDWIVREAAARGIYTIFDLHVWPGQRADYEGLGRPGNQAVRTAMAELWTVVAAHYRGNGSVAAFDVLNEFPGGWGVHQQLFAAIRKSDPARVIAVEGFQYAEFRSLHAAGVFPNSVYSQHFYDFWGDPAVSTRDFQNLLQQFNGSPFPVYIGEFLAEDFGAAARVMDSVNAHWSSWTYKTVDMGTWGMFNYQGWVRTDIQRDSFETIRSKWLNDLTSGQQPGAAPNFTINPNIRAP